MKENTANLRAIKELEAIKLRKKQKEDEKLALEVSQQNHQTISDRRLKQQLLQRQVQMGVPSNIGGVKQDLQAIVVKDTGKRIKNPLEDQIKLIDLAEEEDRDREMVEAFMKKYSKIWKYMYQKYHN